MDKRIIFICFLLSGCSTTETTNDILSQELRKPACDSRIGINSVWYRIYDNQPINISHATEE